MPGTWLLGIVLVILYGFGLIGAVFAYEMYETTLPLFRGERSITRYPLRDYSLPLIIGSVALFVVGLALMVYQPRNPKLQEHPQA